MARYSNELKNTIISKIITGKATPAQIAEETGISLTTLYKWKNRGEKIGVSSEKKESIADKWSSQDKFQIVIETATLNEVEIAEYCRKKGIYPEQIKNWKNTCMQANGGIAQESSRLNLELKNSNIEKKQLEKELKRKNKALAEAAALLVLRKNADAIWGDHEDE
jgi:transposase-like protein